MRPWRCKPSFWPIQPHYTQWNKIRLWLHAKNIMRGNVEHLGPRKIVLATAMRMPSSIRSAPALHDACKPDAVVALLTGVSEAIRFERTTDSVDRFRPGRIYSVELDARPHPVPLPANLEFLGSREQV